MIDPFMAFIHFIYVTHSLSLLVFLRFYFLFFLPLQRIPATCNPTSSLSNNSNSWSGIRSKCCSCCYYCWQDMTTTGHKQNQTRKKVSVLICLSRSEFMTPAAVSVQCIVLVVIENSVCVCVAIVFFFLLNCVSFF